MSLIKFLSSKAFLKQIIIALILCVVLVFAATRWLLATTSHGETIKVPDLSKLSLDIVDKKLDDVNMRFEVLDSANYNPDYPAFSVIEQNPIAGAEVKDNRKIYLTVNPSDYIDVEIPENLINRTLRQVQPTLEAMGFEIGKIIEKPDWAKGAVLELRHDGDQLNAGEMLKKSSVIDIVISDGSLRYSENNDRATEMDTLKTKMHE
ncbi:MAG: PASTA domain-containing protein [Psychroflexus sp.]|nr:PASTA domain-containing protein [Psychroflexus sp.]MDN6316456.1 PASTA domain-containing protein [Lactococcus lactis]